MKKGSNEDLQKFNKNWNFISQAFAYLAFSFLQDKEFKHWIKKMTSTIIGIIGC